MASSTATDDVPNNLASSLWTVNPEKCDLVFLLDYMAKHDDETIDEGDEKGRTPLMIACLYGNLKIVEYLLDHGADVDKQCRQLMNTPLHFTCKWEDSGKPFGDVAVTYNYSDRGFLADKEAIAKLLLEHGAVYRENSLGLTPICYAGLHHMRDIMNLFGGRESIEETNLEKIKGLEFYGASAAINKSSFDETSAHSCMLEAKQLRRGSPYTYSESDRNCDFELPFKRKECNSVEELEALKSNALEIKIEGFLVGARILPDELKPQYFWNNLLHFASECKPGFADSCSIVAFFLKAGKTTKTSIDQLLCALKNAIPHYDPEHRTYSSPLCLELNDVLAVCCDNLTSTWLVNLDIGREDAIFRIIVKILTNAAYSFWASFESFTTTVETAIRILKIIKDRNLSDFASRESDLFFSPWVMIIELYSLNCMSKFVMLKMYDINDAIHHIQHVQYAFSKLLNFDDASRKGPEGKTLLHLVVDFLGSRIFSEDHLKIMLSLIRMLIRHGCPLGARNSDGVTLKEYAVKRTRPGNCITGPEYNCAEIEFTTGIPKFRRNNPTVVQFFEVLTEPSSALSLAELAARVVLKNKIPCRDCLPRQLQDMVYGF